jgi:hypothetical protein
MSAVELWKAWQPSQHRVHAGMIAKWRFVGTVENVVLLQCSSSRLSKSSVLFNTFSTLFPIHLHNI